MFWGRKGVFFLKVTCHCALDMGKIWNILFIYFVLYNLCETLVSFNVKVAVEPFVSFNVTKKSLVLHCIT